MAIKDEKLKKLIGHIIVHRGFDSSIKGFYSVIDVTPKRVVLQKVKTIEVDGKQIPTKHLDYDERFITKRLVTDDQGYFKMVMFGVKDGYGRIYMGKLSD